ncbi:unnamed protein product [Paramecium pentaurelia]|uniref:FCP1 homology domain-containing protein n=1 Tax=Paramecium pentaurelia TaxID=43138 RepID=A0A8S1VF14_9CILI|nr:unnamed protein product [Paramecium pentaurelia]
MYEMRRPLSEKNLGRYIPEQTRPSSANQIKQLTQMKSSTHLSKQNFSYKDQKENMEIRSNQQDTTNKKPNTKEIFEYKKLQDKLSYLEQKIINIKTHIDNSQRQTKQGLASRFFTTKNNDQQQQQQQQQDNINKPKISKNDLDLNQMQNKLKSSTLVNDPRVVSNDNLNKKPSLSTFVTQQKTSSEANIQKIIQIHPESAKGMAQKITFSNNQRERSTKSETQFLYYISSVIRCYMTPEITKPIQQVREHLIQSISAASYSKMKNSQQYEEKRVNLPSISLKKTIVFDLDETLIHCNESIKVPGDVILPIRFPTGDVIEASINIRPYAQQVLQTLSRHFELIVFTASHSCYANVVIDYLDPTKQWISHRFFRESCVQTEEGAFIKDLRVIGNRLLSDLVLVDNAAYSFCMQQLNGIPILNFYDNKSDQELLYLQNYLMAMKYAKDVRQFNQQYLKLDRFGEFKDPIQLLETLFKEYIP